MRTQKTSIKKSMGGKGPSPQKKGKKVEKEAPGAKLNKESSRTRASSKRKTPKQKSL